MNTFWDSKYDRADWLYGQAPNQFLKSQLDQMEPGIILLPAEGEGRNAVYAATSGWHVWAFDSSEVGQQKALGFAASKKISLRYDLVSVEGFHPGETGFHAIGLTYTHFPPDLRHHFFKKLQEWLLPNGKIILEAFRKDQIHRQSGGPKDLDLLYSLEDLRTDFNSLYIEQLTADTIVLNEGPGHQGEAEVVRFVGRKPAH